MGEVKIFVKAYPPDSGEVLECDGICPLTKKTGHPKPCSTSCQTKNGCVPKEAVTDGRNE